MPTGDVLFGETAIFMTNGPTGPKGRTTRTSQPTEEKATENNRANMSGPTGLIMGPSRRQRDAGNLLGPSGNKDTEPAGPKDHK